jgi:hypothetical protein
VPKRLVLCCDGTWNTADQRRDDRPCPTDVTKVALGIADVDAAGVEQRVCYQPGPRARAGERLRGGAFGAGLHDTQLSRSVDAASQALAIDEQRTSFAPAVWQLRPDAGGQEVEQVWSSGVHCDVGGGYTDSRPADTALLWTVERAQRAGLAFRDDASARPGRGGPDGYDGYDGCDGRTSPVDPDPRGRLHCSRRGLFRLRRPHSRPIGAAHPATESVADTAVVRHRDAGTAHAPRRLETHRRTAPRTTQVPLDRPPPAPVRPSGRRAGAPSAVPTAGPPS